MEVAKWTSILSAGKLTSPLQTSWCQDAFRQQMPEQRLSRARHLLLAEATTAPQAGLAPCLQPEEQIQLPMHCSWPGLQTHTGPHAAQVI